MISLWVSLEHMFQGSKKCTISRNCGPPVYERLHMWWRLLEIDGYLLTFLFQLAFLSQTWCLCKWAWPVEFVICMSHLSCSVFFNTMLPSIKFNLKLHMFMLDIVGSLKVIIFTKSIPHSLSLCVTSCNWGLQFLLNTWIFFSFRMCNLSESSQKKYILCILVNCLVKNKMLSVSRYVHLIGEPWFLLITWFFWPPEHAIWVKNLVATLTKSVLLSLNRCLQPLLGDAFIPAK